MKEAWGGGGGGGGIAVHLFPDSQINKLDV